MEVEVSTTRTASVWGERRGMRVRVRVRGGRRMAFGIGVGLGAASGDREDGGRWRLGGRCVCVC